MKSHEFQQAKTFMFADLQREIDLAKAPREKLDELDVTPGGGNFLSALGLLVYTEVAGGVMRGTFDRGEGRNNFGAFFHSMGSGYENFGAVHAVDIYSDFRCGLAHEFYVKRTCVVEMIDKNYDMGIIKRDGKFIFCVERYYNDFKEAFEKLERDKYGSMKNS